MNTHTTVNLDDHAAEFIEQQIDGGNFTSASDVVAAGLKLLRERQEKIERLRAAIIEGEKSGPPQPFDLDEFLQRMHARYAQE